jgi:hypothetical protein
MNKLLGTVALAAALTLTAAPAMAQNINTNGDAAVRARLDSGFTPDPHTVQVAAGGPIDAATVNDSCVGQIARRASFTLRYRQAGELPLIFNAESDVDTTLVVRAPDGSWSCNDDTNGLNPQVRFNSPANGRYQVWVGRYANSEAATATLHVTEIASGGASNGETPDFSLDPAYGSIELAAGFTPDPHTVAIAAGGELDASNLGVPGCVGSIARAPDFRVNWTAGPGNRPLIFSVNSAADTTIVVNDATGNWICDDDGGNEGMNPSVRIENPQSGQYDVWVGVYGGGELQESTLHVSEISTR